jgi:hypothetical protein
MGARATATGNRAEAIYRLAEPLPELYHRARFKLLSQGANPLTLLGFRTQNDGAVAALGISKQGKLQLYSGVVGKTWVSSVAVPTGWHEVELRIEIDGANSETEVWFDGVRVDALAHTVNLGSTPMGQVRLGDAAATRTFDLAFDDVVVSGSRVEPDPDPPPAEAIFSDDFETGDLSRWTTSRGMVVQGLERFAGSSAARGTGTGTPAFLHAVLPSPSDELHVRTRFKILDQGSHALTLMVVRAPSGTAVISASRGANGRLNLWNNVTGKSLASGIGVTSGAWHELQMRVSVAGPAGEVEVWFDGARIGALSVQQSLGSDPIGQLRLGESASGRSFDVVFDDAVASEAFIPA